MATFLLQHLDGCSPLQPCLSCRAAKFLKEKLSTEDFQSLLQLAEQSAGPQGRIFPDEMPVGELPELSMRTRNCLSAENLKTVGDLVSKTQNEILNIPNFGRKSLNEIIASLAQGGRSLGSKPG